MDAGTVLRGRHEEALLASTGGATDGMFMRAQLKQTPQARGISGDVHLPPTRHGVIFSLSPWAHPEPHPGPPAPLPRLALPPAPRHAARPESRASPPSPERSCRRRRQALSSSQRTLRRAACRASGSSPADDLIRDALPSAPTAWPHAVRQNCRCAAVRNKARSCP